MPRKMPLKERLVDRDVLEADDALAFLDLEDAIDEQERIAVRQHLHDVFDGIHGGLPNGVLHERAHQSDGTAVTRA